MLVNSTQQHLALVLMDMCADRDLSTITARDLARSAGVSRQTFYNHFKNIEEATQFASYLPLLLTEPSVKTTYRDLNYNICCFMERHRDFYRQFAHIDSYRPAWTAEFSRLVRKVSTHAPDCVPYRHPIVLSCFMAVFITWWQEGLVTSPGKIADLLSALNTLSEDIWAETPAAAPGDDDAPQR